MKLDATITVSDENNKPIISLYTPDKGSFHELGIQLRDSLKERIISSVRQNMSAFSMNHLAADLVASLTLQRDITFCTPFVKDAAYQYFVSLRQIPSAYGKNYHRVNLMGYTGIHGTSYSKAFELYDEDIVPVTILRKVQFVYDKGDGSKPTWRTVEVTEENGKYLVGLQDGAYKKFLFERIVGGRILPA